MKRKAIALIFAALACACVWLAVNATQNAALAWGLAAALTVLAALIWKGKRRLERKKPVQQVARVFFCRLQSKRRYFSQ